MFSSFGEREKERSLENRASLRLVHLLPRVTTISVASTFRIYGDSIRRIKLLAQRSGIKIYSRLSTVDMFSRINQYSFDGD